MKLFFNSLALLIVSCLAGLGCTAKAADTPFAHPGVLTSQAELDVIQTRVANANPDDPIYAGYLSTMKTKFADMNFVPIPVARPKRHDRKPIDSTVLERDSAMVAYTLTLKWVATGDVAARDKALSIMDAWADVFETHEGDVNRYLDSSWVTPVWCAAGELMRYGKVNGQTAPWPAERVEKFKTMIRHLNDQSSTIITQPFNPVSNWGTSAMLADMAAGVFLDDPKIYNRGRDALLKYMPQIIKKEGYCNEVYRDPWHGTVALPGMIQAAEVGRHQDDLSIYHAKYDGQSEPRLLISLRWYADPLRGIPVLLPPMKGKPEPWEFNGRAATARSTGGFEIALNFYNWIEPAPNLEQFRDAVLKSYRPSGQDNSLFIESDSMTHGDLYDPAFPHPSMVENSASPGEKLTVVLADAVQPEASVADQASFKLITDRYREILWRSNLPAPDTVKHWIGTLNADGSWPDIDYQDKNVAAWKAIDHMTRLGAMSLALANPKSPLFNNEALEAATLRALRYWNANRFQNRNWWHNDIGIPLLMRNVIIALGPRLSGDDLAGALTVLKQFRAPRSGGANTTWAAELALTYGALTGDEALVARNSKVINDEIKISTGEGIQSDFSFHQHGARLQQFHYGSAFLSDSARLGWELRGTPWAIPPEKMAILSAMVLEGSQWMMRGSTVPGTLDRAVSREGLLKPTDLINTARFLRDAVPARAAELDALIARQSGTGAPLNGFRSFPRSDFLAYHRPTFSFFLKTISDRTLGTESINGENLKGQLLNDGDHYLLRRGTEYADLPPVWNWDLLPGVTYADGAGQVQRQPFVGAVGDGASGAAAMDYRFAATTEANKTSPTLSARKFWACDGDIVVALIGDLQTHNVAAPVQTALDQSVLSGPVAIGDDNGTIKTLANGNYPAKKIRWVWHNGLAYLPMNGLPISLRLGPATGTWHSIYQSGSPTPVTKPVFLPILEQGTNPKGQASGYVLAASATPQDAANLAARPTWTVLRNDANCQAVAFGDGRVMAAFYVAGTLERDGKPLLQTDRPCLIIFNNDELSVCDPTQKGGTIHLRVASGKTITATLPAQGLSVKLEEIGT